MARASLRRLGDSDIVREGRPWLKHVQLKITGTLERIPAGDADSPEFVAWCEENGVHPLGGGEYGRRGWWGAYNTYIGNSDYVFYTDSGRRYC